ncbi:uncharacterized protein BO95DRAFT_429786 [Aspergillus brunneoviolaceus CBS 621.78]|uniref:Uncharacterized protein n=1 Tax=Aspergillus brunneoviolaceus CBS 621.78 TaxID=1450534 RepID=A0ACD1GFS3_9EURO|nr:hypothetical protein BO95DRAFT_429786 [Aspergillus brunneoviolaceus CBS 621.78]RAH48077.1 hypothetical protein BO95DRAFT_429786 [Aspergillus brunneoviolaceus CBS 621.78]
MISSMLRPTDFPRLDTVTTADQIQILSPQSERSPLRLCSNFQRSNLDVVCLLAYLLAYLDLGLVQSKTTVRSTGRFGSVSSIKTWPPFMKSPVSVFRELPPIELGSLQEGIPHQHPETTPYLPYRR